MNKVDVFDVLYSRPRLFEARDPLSDVNLNASPDAVRKFWLYAEAFHTAARQLAADSSVRGMHLRDVGACPVVYLYRHSLELYLKTVAITGCERLRRSHPPLPDIRELLHANHNLAWFVPTLRKLFRLVGWKWNSEARHVEWVVKELAKQDPKSFFFRYPSDKDGNQMLPDKCAFSLCGFAEAMDRALAFLKQIDCGLSAMADTRD